MHACVCLTLFYRLNPVYLTWRKSDLELCYWINNQQHAVGLSRHVPTNCSSHARNACVPDRQPMSEAVSPCSLPTALKRKSRNSQPTPQRPARRAAFEAAETTSNYPNDPTSPPCPALPCSAVADPHRAVASDAVSTRAVQRPAKPALYSSSSGLPKLSFRRGGGGSETHGVHCALLDLKRLLTQRCHRRANLALGRT